MSESFTPPPRRPAPEELRRRIAADLARAEGGASRRARVLVPVAAALVLLAGVGGILGASRLDGQRDLVPVDRPSPSQTNDKPEPQVSPTPRTTASAEPEVLKGQPMTAAQIRRDTKTCTTAEAGAGDPEPRRGTLRPIYAFVQPLVTDGAPVNQRVLFLQDEAGQLQCVDGLQRGWSSLPVQGFEPTAKVPGGQVPNSGSTSGTCGKVAESVVDSDVLLQVDQKRVAAARVTLVSDGQVARLVDVSVQAPTVYLGVRLTGAAARLPMSYRVQLVDDQGDVVKIQPYGEAGTRPADRLSLRMDSCADSQARIDRSKPKQLPRPSSDKAGLASCLKLVKADGDQPLDLQRTTAEVTVSTKQEWGAVLSDGSHELGCSLYPTKEISAAQPVTSNPPTTKEAFSWATNPIAEGGESLWAGGYLPGATKIIYQLPDGTNAEAKINSAGYWMVKAQTTTLFGSGPKVSDWEPVTITVTRNGDTSTYSVPWTDETMCNQVSHGC